jgi:hypothetical protein
MNQQVKQPVCLESTAVRQAIVALGIKTPVLRAESTDGGIRLFLYGGRIVERLNEGNIQNRPLGSVEEFPPALLEKLREAGFETVAAVQSATSDELLAVPGVGPKMVALIRRLTGDTQTVGGSA